RHTRSKRDWSSDVCSSDLPEHLESLLAKLREMGVGIESKDDQLLITSREKLNSVDIKTLVYPGFPTDLQQPFTSLLTKTTGASRSEERRVGKEIRDGRWR